MAKQGRHPNLLIFVVVAALYLLGAFNAVDRAVQDGIFEISKRDAEGRIVLVEVDSKSLKQLDVWPWVRSYHAQVLRQLLEAGADTVAFDIDFSSRTVAAQDRTLADALRRAAGRVVLPVFRQRASDSRGRVIETYTDPIGVFARNAELASVNVPLDPDGRVRQYETATSWRDRTLPTLAARLSKRGVGSAERFYVDFGIRPETIARLSFVDVLRGEFDPGVVSNKVVIIGATAIELGDRLPVPVYGVLSGPEFQAMAFESIVQGRTIQKISPWITLAITLMIAAFLGRWHGQTRIRIAGFATVAFLPASFAVATGLQWLVPIGLDLSPWWAVVVASYSVHMVKELDRRTLQIFVHRLAAMQRRAMLNSVVDDSSDGIIIADEYGMVQLFNPMASRMLQMAPDAAIGQPIGDTVPAFASFLVAGEDEATHDRPVVGPGIRHEVNVERPEDGAFTVELVVNASKLKSLRSPRLGGGDGDRVHILTFRDITERKRTEEAERRAMEEAIAASRAKSEFLANVSHELRTPLNAIIGFSEMMKTEMFGPMGADQYRDYSADIFASGSHLLEVINDILDMSKIEAGEMRLQEQEVALDSVVASCLRLICERAKDAGLAVTSDVPASLPRLLADPRLLKQILLNLLSNAVKFTPSGGNICVRCSLAKNGTMTMAVTDTGIGMAAEDIPRALAAFGQVDTRLERKYEGTGLGLPLVKSMADLHGAIVDIESEIGRGTTVTVTFEADRVAKQEKAPPKRRRKVTGVGL